MPFTYLYSLQALRASMAYSLSLHAYVVTVHTSNLIPVGFGFSLDAHYYNQTRPLYYTKEGTLYLAIRLHAL